MSDQYDKRTECYSCKHRRSIPNNAHILCANPSIFVKGEEYGVKNGWFIYPLMFDPTWKTDRCKNFEEFEWGKGGVPEATPEEFGRCLTGLVL